LKDKSSLHKNVNQGFKILSFLDSLVKFTFLNLNIVVELVV